MENTDEYQADTEGVQTVDEYTTRVLHTIQQELVAPKARENKYQGYKYRSAEDILKAVKPLLVPYKGVIRFREEPIQVGERFYIKSEVSLELLTPKSCGSVAGGTVRLTGTGWAREQNEKKGNDESQVTGASISYARKYALNALFAIDSGEDIDPDNTSGKEEAKQLPVVKPAKVVALPDKLDEENTKALMSAKTVADLNALGNQLLVKKVATKKAIASVLNLRKEELEKERLARLKASEVAYEP